MGPVTEPAVATAEAQEQAESSLAMTLDSWSCCCWVAGGPLYHLLRRPAEKVHQRTFQGIASNLKHMTFTRDLCPLSAPMPRPRR